MKNEEEDESAEVIEAIGDLVEVAVDIGLVEIILDVICGMPDQ